MKYPELRKYARTGDVLLVQGRGLVSSIIRMMTGESISHVAVLVWIGETLWVAEMKEFRGYRLRPASLWVEDTLAQASLWHGVASPQVAGHPESARKAALLYRNRTYSYRTLFRVWLSQLIGRKVPGALVCSTFVQKVWEACGIQFDKTADPGDIWAKCEAVHKVTA